MQSWIKIEWEHIVNEKSINLEKTTSSVLSALLLVYGCRINQIALHVIYPASMELNHILSSPAFPARTASACKIFNSASLSPFSPFKDMVGIEKKFFIQHWLFSKLWQSFWSTLTAVQLAVYIQSRDTTPNESSPIVWLIALPTKYVFWLLYYLISISSEERLKLENDDSFAYPMAPFFDKQIHNKNTFI